MMSTFTLIILVSMFVLICGQGLVWRQRNNIFMYMTVGVFFSSYLVPLLGGSLEESSEPAILALYARILLLGAIAFIAGLMFGSHHAIRSASKARLTMISLDDGPDVGKKLSHRTLVLAAIGGVALFGSFTILGFVPAFAEDRLSAKYGVGAYLEAFSRGALVYRFGLALAAAVLPLVMVFAWSRRQLLDFGLVAVLGGGLLLTLSRDAALAGPALVLVATGIWRGLRPWVIVAGVCLAFSVASAGNALIFPTDATAGQSLVSRVAAGTPDVSDQVAFLQGFVNAGSQRVGVRTLVDGIGLGEGPWDPGTYTLRILTGAEDVSGFASGGLRLPAPIWGYVAFGFAGSCLWSFLAGVFTGWGTIRVRRMLRAAEDGRTSPIELVLAWVIYTGTFGVLAGFYFPQTSDLVLVAVALSYCSWDGWRNGLEPQASALVHVRRG